MATRKMTFLLAWGLAAWISALGQVTPNNASRPNLDFGWPPATNTMRPWAYWWWLGSAVDRANLTRELERYQAAGLGGVHVIPIYGAKGFEDRYLEYLSPPWLDMLRHTVAEAQRLGLGVDMTTGSGWCFGGPHVAEADANALAVVKTYDVAAGAKLSEKFPANQIQALVAFGPAGPAVELTGKITADGTVDWVAEGGPWKVYAVSQKPSGQKVKRAAPGGAGHMLNLLYPSAMERYLARFTEAFARHAGPQPRAMYHDSYEYRSDWAPDFLAQFEQRRGYRLQAELPALFGKEESDQVARVKSDYRETVSDALAEQSLPQWTRWAHQHGFLTRNQAHGSPGNLLDLYAAADIPETEMFHTDRNLLVSKLASAAAHVTGRNLVAAETGTWLKEHFTETLADLKGLFDDLFLSGVNHLFYHGTCYSPDEAGWPGWLFYASTEMNPRNSIWRDAPALNEYAARCQAVLQGGQPDHDILLYWPIYDTWHNPKGLGQNFTVHARGWFEGQALGRAAGQLWRRGFAFDYVSDRQLVSARAATNGVALPGAAYRVVAVPACHLMPLDTLARLLKLAEAGATVVFEEHPPTDVPGLGNWAQRRAAFQKLLAPLKFSGPVGGETKVATVGSGRVITGGLEAALVQAGVARETLTDQAGLMFIRRGGAASRHYFIANRGDQTLDQWIPLAARAPSVVLMDPMTGRTGLGAVRADPSGLGQVYLQLQPGESVILRLLVQRQADGPPWPYFKVAGPPIEIAGAWQVQFIQGGPELPRPFQTTRLASWTELGDETAQRFAGTARYTITFDAPPQPAQSWWLDLGRVCQSARVRLNDRDLGTLFQAPFRVRASPLKTKGNRLEVEATNVSANRIRDLDRRGVKWKNFNDINFVNLNYKPFDASNWPLYESGLIGPVTLTPASAIKFD